MKILEIKNKLQIQVIKFIFLLKIKKKILLFFYYY